MLLLLFSVFSIFHLFVRKKSWKKLEKILQMKKYVWNKSTCINNDLILLYNLKHKDSFILSDAEARIQTSTFHMKCILWICAAGFRKLATSYNKKVTQDILGVVSVYMSACVCAPGKVAANSLLLTSVGSRAGTSCQSLLVCSLNLFMLFYWTCCCFTFCSWGLKFFKNYFLMNFIFLVNILSKNFTYDMRF